MLQRTKKRTLLNDDNAISEEFTALPSLSLIMIGVVLFSILIISTYESYEAQNTKLSQIDIARYLLSKTIDPDQLYMLDGNIVDLSYFNRNVNISNLENIKEDLSNSGIDFSISLSWENNSHWVFGQPPGFDQMAVSRPISIAINPVDVVAGTITIVVWGHI